MEFNNIFDILSCELKSVIEHHKGLPTFAQQRAKFEGWLKVELCGILLKHFPDTLPEKDRTDLTAGDWVIELKTFSTSYRQNGVVNKTRPITDNVTGVCKDIEKLRKVSIRNQLVIFVVFPLNEDNQTWLRHLNKIKGMLKEIKIYSFCFAGDIPGIIYFGLV